MKTLSSRVYNIWKFTIVNFPFDLQYKQSWNNSGEACKVETKLMKTCIERKRKKQSRMKWGAGQRTERKWTAAISLWQAKEIDFPFKLSPCKIFTVLGKKVASKQCIHNSACYIFCYLSLWLSWWTEQILDLQFTILLSRTRIQFYITSPSFTNYKNTRILYFASILFLCFIQW